MVFSDLHYGENPWDVWGPEQDKNSTILMKTVLKEEPDYVYVRKFETRKIIILTMSLPVFSTATLLLERVCH